MTTKIIAAVQYTEGETSRLEVFERAKEPPKKPSFPSAKIMVPMGGVSRTAKELYAHSHKKIYAATIKGVCCLDLEESLKEPDGDKGRTEFAFDKGTQLTTGKIVSLDDRVYWGVYESGEVDNKEVLRAGGLMRLDEAAHGFEAASLYAPDGPIDAIVIGAEEDKEDKAENYLLTPSDNRIFFINVQTNSSHKLTLPLANGYGGERGRRIAVTAMATSPVFNVASLSDGHYHVFDRDQILYTSPSRADLDPEQCRLSLNSPASSAAIYGNTIVLGTDMGRLLAFEVQLNPFKIQRRAFTSFVNEGELNQDAARQINDKDYHPDYRIHAIKIVQLEGNPYVFLACKKRVYEFSMADLLLDPNSTEKKRLCDRTSYRRYQAAHRIKALEVVNL